MVGIHREVEMEKIPELRLQPSNDPAGYTAKPGGREGCPLCGSDTHFGLLMRLLTTEDLCELFFCGPSSIRKMEELGMLNRVPLLTMVRFLPIEVARLLGTRDQV